MRKTYTEDAKREPLRELLRQALPDQDASSNEEVASLSGTQLRDRLIAHQPLDTDWIKRVNQVSKDGALTCETLFAAGLTNFLYHGVEPFLGA